MSDSSNASDGTDQSVLTSSAKDFSSVSSTRIKSVDPQLQLSLPIGWISPVGHWRAAYTEPHSTHFANSLLTSSLFAIPLRTRDIIPWISLPIFLTVSGYSLQPGTDRAQLTTTGWLAFAIACLLTLGLAFAISYGVVL